MLLRSVCARGHPHLNTNAPRPIIPITTGQFASLPQKKHSSPSLYNKPVLKGASSKLQKDAEELPQSSECMLDRMDPDVRSQIPAGPAGPAGPATLLPPMLRIPLRTVTVHGLTHTETPRSGHNAGSTSVAHSAG